MRHSILSVILSVAIPGIAAVGLGRTMGQPPAPAHGPTAAQQQAQAPGQDHPAMHPVTGFVRALENADSQEMSAAFADDATVFMPFDRVPQRFTGKQEVVAIFEKLFEQMRASGREPPFLKLTPKDLHVQELGDAVAVVTFHLGDVLSPATTRPMAFSRRTFVVQRHGNQWLISHLHASNVEFEPPQNR